MTLVDGEALQRIYKRVLSPELLGLLALGLGELRVSGLTGGRRTAESCVEDAGLAIVRAGDDGDHRRAQNRPADEARGVPATSPRCIVHDGFGHGIISHYRAVQPARDFPELRGQGDGLDEECGSPCELLEQVIDHGF